MSPARASKRKRWSVTVAIDGRDRGHWRSVETVEPWTAIYHVLKYGISDKTLTGIEGMTITVRPDPVPPTVPPPAGRDLSVQGGTDYDGRDGCIEEDES